MPSGSHGGGGGSHFSGGGSHFSGGGHSSFGGSFRSGPRPIRSRRVIIFGRPYIFTTGGSNGSLLSLFGVMIAIAIVVLFGSILVSTSANSKIHTIEEDYKYYQEMISYAKDHPEYKKTAIITDRFQSENSDKYYLTYKIACSSCAGGYLEGYTYSVYTLTEIREFQVGDEVDAAVNSKVVTEATDSITMDYENKTLADDGEYANEIKTKKGGSVVAVIAGIGIVGAIAGLVYAVKKSLKREEEKKVAQEKAASEAAYQESIKNTCPYCGQLLNEGTTKCPNCGAGLKKR